MFQGLCTHKAFGQKPRDSENKATHFPSAPFLRRGPKVWHHLFKTTFKSNKNFPVETLIPSARVSLLHCQAWRNLGVRFTGTPTASIMTNHCNRCLFLDGSVLLELSQKYNKDTKSLLILHATKAKFLINLCANKSAADYQLSSDVSLGPDLKVQQFNTV